MIFGTDVDAFIEKVASETKAQLKRNKDSMRRAQEAWRSQGAVGKLHNLIRAIRISAQRSEYFKNISIGDDKIDKLQPIQDNDTRWLSHYSSIERALLIKPRLHIFSTHYQEAYDHKPLTSDDWKTLQDLFTVLQPFFYATKDLQSSATEGHHGSVWEWIPTIEYLMMFTKEKSSEFEVKYGQRHPMTVATQNAWQKLDIYWRLSDGAETIYAAVTLLAPCGRKAYFDRNWTEEETNSIFTTVYKY